MQITMQMGPEFQATVQRLGKMGAALIAAADKGMQAGGKITAGRISRDYLSGQALKRRTGLLAKTVDTWPGENMLETVVCVPANSPVCKYAWLLSDETKTITPKRGKSLAIPAGEGLTPAGVARWSGPREASAQLGSDRTFFIRKNGQLLFGYKRGNIGGKGKFRLLFVLTRSVMIQGTGALADGVLENLDTISAEMEHEIGRVEGVN
jgi:hypothetical protein